MEELLDKNRDVRLFDYYGCLLTTKQQAILEEYYYDDLSLSEIAEIHSISKSAVYDMIKKAMDKMKVYETKLSLSNKEDQINKILEMENISEEVRRKIKEVMHNGI